MKKISLIVIGLHAILLIISLSAPGKVLNKEKRLVVHTVPLREKTKKMTPSGSMQQPPSALTTKPKKEKEQKALPKPKAKASIDKKPAPKPAATKKTAPLKKSEPKKAVAIPQHLLKELEETIAKIDGNREKYTNKKSFAEKKIKPLQSESLKSLESESELGSYRDTLVDYLHQVLNLPDYGEVKVQVTLSADGSIENLKVIKAESSKNRKYLETHLPDLRFPPLQGFSKKTEETFIFTFCNEL